MIEKSDKQNFIVYQIQKTPWPLSYRDAVVKVSTTLDWENGHFTVLLQDIEDERIPPASNLVRLKRLHGRWDVEHLDSEQSRVTYTITADPGGVVPTGLVNGNLQKAPYTTLLGLQRIVRKPDYVEAANQTQHKHILEQLSHLESRKRVVIQ